MAFAYIDIRASAVEARGPCSGLITSTPAALGTIKQGPGGQVLLPPTAGGQVRQHSTVRYAPCCKSDQQSEAASPLLAPESLPHMPPAAEQRHRQKYYSAPSKGGHTTKTKQRQRGGETKRLGEPQSEPTPTVNCQIPQRAYTMRRSSQAKGLRETPALLSPTPLRIRASRSQPARPRTNDHTGIADLNSNECQGEETITPWPDHQRAYTMRRSSLAKRPSSPQRY